MDKIDILLEKVTKGYLEQDVPYEIPISIYPANSDKIIVIAPGAGESKDGRKNRWATLGRYLQSEGVGTVVTYHHPQPDAQGKYPDEPYSYKDASWNKLVVESLDYVIEYSLDHSGEICNSVTPSIYLAGFSAGGSACGAVAPFYPEVSKILMISAYDSVGIYFYEGISRFTGEIYMTYGSEDPIAVFLAYSMRFTAREASLLHTQEIQNCKHGFAGATNSKILSNAFKWAFAGDTNFPSPDGGLLLYED
jgi:hypothetical protein